MQSFTGAAGGVLAQRGFGLDLARDSLEHAHRGKKTLADAEAKVAAGEALAQRGTSLDLARDSPEYAQRGRQARRAEAKAKTGTGETPVAQTREATVAEAKTGSGEMSSPVRPSL